MTNEEQLTIYYKVISSNYQSFKKKMKQFCFLNHLDYDDDIFQETVLKVAEMTKKRGLRDCSDKGIMNYLFMGFKLNTYQNHLQKTKKRRDDNVDVYRLELEDINYTEEDKLINDLSVRYILNQVKLNFDLISYSVWRLRYLVKLNRRRIEFQKNQRINKNQ